MHIESCETPDLITTNRLKPGLQGVMANMLTEIYDRSHGVLPGKNCLDMVRAINIRFFETVSEAPQGGTSPIPALCIGSLAHESWRPRMKRRHIRSDLLMIFLHCFSMKLMS